MGTSFVIMEEPILVSIIIPVYNVKQYLVEAIESVLSQTYKTVEIIIIDDGSTDGSSNICDEYARKDPRIHVIHQKNMGLSNARNRGLCYMSGEVVAFLDPDDAYSPDYISVMLNTMIRKDAEVVICKYSDHRTSSKMVLSDQHYFFPKAKEGEYDRIHVLRALADDTIDTCIWNKLSRKELWENIRFPDGHVYEDRDTTFRILNKCKTAYVIDQPLYMHRRHKGSITETVSWNNTNDRLLSNTHFYEFVASNTPFVFTIEQKKLAKRRQHACLEELIIHYLRFHRNEYYNGKIIEESMKKTIIQKGREIGVHNSIFRTKLLFHMIQICPLLLRMIYELYRKMFKLNQFVKK